MAFTVADEKGYHALTIEPAEGWTPETILDLLNRAKLSLKGAELIADGTVVGLLDKSGDWFVDIGPLEWLDIYHKLAAPAPLILSEPSGKNALLIPQQSDPSAREICEAFNAGKLVGLPNTWLWQMAEGLVAILEQVNGGKTIDLPTKE
ncbi:MAG TPA: hypothetical protein V6C97_33450 [Oculatellaceae cyanobacterium]